jgi:hypothetical protein
VDHRYDPVLPLRDAGRRRDLHRGQVPIRHDVGTRGDGQGGQREECHRRRPAISNRHLSPPFETGARGSDVRKIGHGEEAFNARQRNRR